MIEIFYTYVRKGERMAILNTSKILICFMFTLLTGSAWAAYPKHNQFEESFGEYISYRDVYCQFKHQQKNSPISHLDEDEQLFYKKFFVQLIKSYNQEASESPEELGRRRFADIESQYLNRKLRLATATNDRQELLGAMFFCTENDNAEIIIKGLITDNINDEGLYQQLCSGMIQIIKDHFPNTRKIRILELTVPQALQATLENLGFKNKFVNLEENKAWVLTPVFELQISSWKQWCNLV